MAEDTSARRKDNTDNDLNLNDQLENPWESLSKAQPDNNKIEEDKDDFKSAFKEFQKTITFKALVVVVTLAILGGIGWGIYALTTAEFTAGQMDVADFMQYYEENSSSIWTAVQIGCFALVMFIFAARDLVSFKKGQHLESKSIIVSIGIAGTFLGIFLGLQGFDTNDITGSVPRLLDGLKLAFSTSILGMFITIPLTAMQQMPNVDSKAEMRTLISIDEKLSSVELLPAIAKDMRKSMEATVDMKADIKDTLIEENSNRTNEILGQIAARSAKKVELLTALELSINALVATNSELATKLSNAPTPKDAVATNRVTGSVPSVYE